MNKFEDAPGMRQNIREGYLLRVKKAKQDITDLIDSLVALRAHAEGRIKEDLDSTVHVDQEKDAFLKREKSVLPRA